MGIINKIKTCLYWFQIEKKYKQLHVYVDELNNLLIIPTGKSKKWQIICTIDLVFELHYPYSDIEVEDILLNCLDKCYSLKPNDNLNESYLAKYLGYKSYKMAVKKKRAIGVDWLNNEGFRIKPTEKKKGQGYVHLENEIITLKRIKTRGDLGKAFKEVLSKSKILSE